MAYNRSFFERLNNADVRDATTVVDKTRVARSVLRHLMQMLNTRRGSVPTQPDYGLPDFNDMVSRFPDAIQELKKEIKFCLEKYEPRLSQIHVGHIADKANPLALRYEISATLMLDNEKSDIWFETTLNSMGKVSVRG
ncbi:MAG: type VI secretion system baseplate subunit TssE [Gammaproteobacteria bacterium]|nr:type VI secretion system baseplate subunit TssE [Gammaproteobacteria bacterium]